MTWAYHSQFGTKKNADGSESDIKEFTSLLGSQKKKLLKGIPQDSMNFCMLTYETL